MPVDLVAQPDWDDFESLDPEDEIPCSVEGCDNFAEHEDIWFEVNLCPFHFGEGYTPTGKEKA